ncbi:zinc finger protein 564-like isoform X3 [Cyclopterus lumpus]|uniref:zinc finger protein 564-like isoform X3 n=1 Tax=Cyclopterus lumpus TaxID=8103 RepID=UPI00148695F8|nr:zinc finger protein 564-like isoform X3 [Cyclopterus lumpus]
MSQIEELKVFVSERLYAAASEIFGAVEKTITDYEETVTRLKEENDRNRSLLDIILKTKSPPQKEGACPAKSTPAAAAAAPGASDSSLARKARYPPRNSSDSQCSFTSRTDFLDFATNDNCRYCLKRIQATETHLTRKHYLFAVHFTECGAGYPILQQSQNTEMDQPSVSAIEEDVPLSPAPWYQQELGSLDQEDQQASLLLHVKEEEEEEQETCRQVSHPEWQNSVHVKIEGEQMSVEEHHAQDSEFSIVCADSYIQDLSVESSKRHLLPNSSNQPLEMLPDSGVGGIYKPAEESQHTTPRTSLKALGIKRKVPVKRKKSNIKTSTLSVSQNPTGPHCCKACGKTFDYMYTLRTHVLTHAGDTIHICGICGKHLESMESFVQHIQSHTTRNKCGICGKQFSNNFRLKRHRRFHRPKGLNVMSST